MNSIMGNFFHWLLRASWQAAILVLLILALQWAFGKKLGARWRHALWFLVLVRLTLLFSPASAFSLFNFAPVDKAIPAQAPVAAPVAVTPAPVLRAQIPAVNVPAGSPNVEYFAANQTVSAPVEPAKPTRTFANRFRNLKIPLLCAWLWAAGVLLLLARIIGQNVIFLRGLRSARMIEDGETLALFGRCRAVLGVRTRFRLAETAQVKSPALYGLFRPWLLLPVGMTQRFGPEELRHIFLHELAHVKRRDMAVHWAATALQVLHWFNPVLWFGFRRMAADREVACDELALLYAGDCESRSYGETIIKLLELCASPSASPGLLGILEDKNQMTRRIAMIAGFKRHSRWSLPAMALLLALGLAGLTDAKPRVIAAKPAGVTTNAPFAGVSEPMEVLPGENLMPSWQDDLSGGGGFSVKSAKQIRDGQRSILKETKITHFDEHENAQFVLEAAELVFDRAKGQISSTGFVKLSVGNGLFTILGLGFHSQKNMTSYVFSNVVHAVANISGGTNSELPGPGEIFANGCEYTPGTNGSPDSVIFSGNTLMNTADGWDRADSLKIQIDRKSPALHRAGASTLVAPKPVMILAQNNPATGQPNQNLDNVIREDQAAIAVYEKDRQQAAAAVFHLGETFRQAGRTSEANAQYERILREFPDETRFTGLSQQYLLNLPNTPPAYLLSIGDVFYPGGVAVDSTGNVYVSDTQNNRIKKFTVRGVAVTQWGGAGSDAGYLNYPQGLAIDSSNNLYVADVHNHRIQKFASNGTFITQWGELGSGPGQFNCPYNVAVDTTGNVYVVDNKNNRVQKFTGAGVYLKEFGTLGTGIGQLQAPQGVAVDRSGNIFVGDGGNMRIQKFGADGAVLPGWICESHDVAVDARGNVYVVAGDAIKVFSSDGNLLSQWGSKGTGPGQFDFPARVAVDPTASKVLVTDAHNNRVELFAYPSPASGK